MASELTTSVAAPAPSVIRALRDRTATLDLVIYWRSIARRKWMILAIAVAIAVGAGVVVNLMAPVYRSTVTVLIEQNKPKVSPTEEVTGGVGDAREFFQTQAEILKSRSVATRLVDTLKLTESAGFDPRQRKPGTVESIKKAIGLGSQTTAPTDEDIKKAVVAGVMGSTSVEPVRLSQLIRVSFESTDPVLAAKIANGLADVYIESDVDARAALNERATEWLGSRLAGLKKNLEDSERALQAYRESARIVETRGLAQSGVTRQIEDLMTRLVAARQRRFAAESAYNQVAGTKDRPDLLPIAMRNPIVQQLKDAELDAERRLTELSNRYGPDHPRMVQAEADLKQARDNTRRQVGIAVSSLANEYELARANERAIERELASAKTNVQGINRKEFELASLERAVATNRQIYELFLNRFRETKASKDLQQSAVARISDPARPAEYPFKPQKEQLIAIAFVLGLAFGVLIALLLERLDNTLKVADDVDEKLGRPLLTTLPLLSASANASVGRHYIEDPRSIFSEAIRTARTGILLSAGEVEHLIVLVTSSLPGEGKTAVAANLALAQSQTKRVLIVDGDLRRPSLGKALALDGTKPGLTDLLSGSANFADCLQRVPGSSLFAMTTGPVPLNPLEMILSQRFQQLLRALAGTCDVLIIDSPPVHLVSDAVALAPVATGVVFVVKGESTPYPLVRRCVRSIEEVEGRLFGIALNQVDFKKASRYYGAYSGGYYEGYSTYAPKSLGQAKQPVLTTS